jgi:UDP-N-acetylglucosamine 3-dehydrogenase
MSYTIAIIGTGPEPHNQVWGESAAMAYRHGWGYQQLEQCNLVACADLIYENAEAFADEFDINRDNIYEDYEQMLYDIEPDIVSIATPVPTHADIVVDIAKSEIPAAIHCEKPMAETWGDSQRMAIACDDHDIQLTFNHQRRFDPRWRDAKELLDNNEIGALQRLEIGGKNLFDFGTHLIDLCNLYNDEQSAEWVLAAVEYREENIRYGSHNENQSVAVWEYSNGVQGFASTGQVGQTVVGCQNRLIGDEGIIEVNPSADDSLRINRFDGYGWEAVALDEPEMTPIDLGIEHIVKCLDMNEEPELGAANALSTMEIIFGAYESVRARGRVELPLDIKDNPLDAMVNAGELQPRPKDGK